MHHEEENLPFKTAWHLVNFTGRHLFLTGRAGTGKTTFLRKLIAETSKKCVVLAPTGVAAVNAGGMTMHSFFQLPFQPFLKHGDHTRGVVQFSNRVSLLRELRFNQDKLQLLRELELLVIDEVSMLRADMLDAMDVILCHVRGLRSVPFGGVQVLFIGDLFQLPPVVKDHEQSLLLAHYPTPFFFSAEVIQEAPLLQIELKQIYRQKEAGFIHLLNHIRNNEADAEDYALLESRRIAPGAGSNRAGGITLTTHNHMADRINREELERLPGRIRQFTAIQEGEFHEKSFPTERVLELKEGAQVMFLRNDASGKNRYYNGKLAQVVHLGNEEIEVELAGSGLRLKIERESWENVRYQFNREENRVDRETLGTFQQYPLRLAWAITIHKSQGLTFEQVSIDAGAAFAAGQVYVALSRCTSLSGLTLLSRITPESIRVDPQILAFAAQETDPESLDLQEEMFRYSLQRLTQLFSWIPVQLAFRSLIEFTAERKFEIQWDVMQQLTLLEQETGKMQELAERFMEQMNQLMTERPLRLPLLEERVKKAKSYFLGRLHDGAIVKMENIVERALKVPRTKQFVTRSRELIETLWRRLHQMERAGVSGLEVEVETGFRKASADSRKAKRDGKQVKSAAVSLGLYQEGKKVEEIAAQRNISQATVERHLLGYIGSGQVRIEDLVTPEQMRLALLFIRQYGTTGIYASFQEILSGQMSYGQFRSIAEHLRVEEERDAGQSAEQAVSEP